MRGKEELRIMPRVLSNQPTTKMELPLTEREDDGKK